MPNMKIYLDTSIISFLYADDAPEYKKETKRFFDTVLVPGKIDAYISSVVMDEIHKTKEARKRETLLETFNTYSTIQTVVAATEEELNNIELLSKTYLDREIIPRSKLADALHIAYATVFHMDILLSWNFKHLANINKEQKILVVNRSYGFQYPFRMANPLEVIFDDE